MVNLDDTRNLERIAAALEDISRGIGSLRDGQAVLIALEQSRDKGLDTIVDAYEKWGEAAGRVAREPEKAEAAAPVETRPTAIPVMLIVEVLIALIGIFRRLNVDSIEDAKLRILSRKLEPYQPVRPAGKEAE